MRLVQKILIICLLLVVAVAVMAQEPLPEATTEPGVVAAGLDPLPLLVDARTDLELLASAMMGPLRPEGWSGSLDTSAPQLTLLIRLDLELLAGGQLGADARPDGWFGAVPSTAYFIARDIRHDLELLADNLQGPDVRPDGWTGADPLLRCERGTQTLVSLLVRGDVLDTSAIDPASADYCQALALLASQFSEVNLLSLPPGQPIFAAQTQADLPGAITIASEFAVAFLDRGASQSVGVIPLGTAVTPLARSYVEFSKMLLVEGDGFRVFVDYRDTTLPAEVFDVLGDVDFISTQTLCQARWCTD